MDIIKQLKEQHIELLDKTIPPTSKDNNWRFNSIETILEAKHHNADKKGVVATEQLLSFYKNSNFDNYLLLNGQFQSADSSLPLCSHPTEKDLCLIKKELDYFQLLNLTDPSSVLFLKIETDLKRPILITHITSNQTEGSFVKPLIIIKSLPGSKSTIIERFVHTGKIQNSYTSLPFTIINCEKNSTLEHIKIQDECLKAFHIGSVNCNLAENAKVSSFSLSLGGKISRNSINVNANQKNSTAKVNGIYFGKMNQVTDNFININHNAPETTSSQLFKGVLDDSSRGIFTGSVKVAKDAQKVDAVQLSRTLLLSDSATSFARPELEIDADDVKCSHGATVGQISEDELFYLTSRGIPQARAMKMLYSAYTLEVIDLINDDRAKKLCKDVISKTYDKRIKQATKVCR